MTVVYAFYTFISILFTAPIYIQFFFIFIWKMIFTSKELQSNRSFEAIYLLISAGTYMSIDITDGIKRKPSLFTCEWKRTQSPYIIHPNWVESNRTKPFLSLPPASFLQNVKGIAIFHDSKADSKTRSFHYRYRKWMKRKGRFVLGFYVYSLTIFIYFTWRCTS